MEWIANSGGVALALSKLESVVAVVAFVRSAFPPPLLSPFLLPSPDDLMCVTTPAIHIQSFPPLPDKMFVGEREISPQSQLNLLLDHMHTVYPPMAALGNNSKVLMVLLATMAASTMLSAERRQWRYDRREQ